jgi:peroxiredoxin Q/BCP
VERLFTDKRKEMKNLMVLFGVMSIVLTLFSFEYLMNSKKLGEGDKIPLFTLVDQDNNSFSVEDYIGKTNLVIYFYPKDDTPGCTKEACKFRDEFEVFTDLDAQVVGVSSDSPESHLQFKEKYNLPFTLLSDSDGSVRALFGVDGNYNGLRPGRVTFVVNKKGGIQYVFDSSSDIEAHILSAQKVLKNIQH